MSLVCGVRCFFVKKLVAIEKYLYICGIHKAMYENIVNGNSLSSIFG